MWLKRVTKIHALYGEVICFCNTCQSKACVIVWIFNGHKYLKWTLTDTRRFRSTNFTYLRLVRLSQWGSHISRQSAHESGKVVSPTHRPPLPPRRYSWYSLLLEAESTPGPEGLSQWKISMIPSGIEPATFRLVAQCLNQLRHRVPPFLRFSHQRL
jgi:hypothetical protein